VLLFVTQNIVGELWFLGANIFPIFSNDMGLIIGSIGLYGGLLSRIFILVMLIAIQYIVNKDD